MGGCIVSCMVMKDKGARERSAEMQVVREMKCFSVETDFEQQEPGFSKIRRSPSAAAVEPKQWWDTYYGEKPAQSWRPIVKVEKMEREEPDGTKKSYEVTFLKPTVSITFNEMWQRMVAFGHGLLALGLPPGANVGLYEETCASWLVSCF